MTQRRNVTIVEKDIEAYAWHAARGAPRDVRRDAAAIRRWSTLGAMIVREHHRYPHLICEIETSRGCPRRAHCSFCSEGIFGAPEFRPAEDICAEIDALAEHGITHFRIARDSKVRYAMFGECVYLGANILCRPEFRRAEYTLRAK